MLSFDQRGFGESGGFAHVENPRFEGATTSALVRLVSRLPWVKQDGPGDPRLGAIGGSYGGGYQFLGAFEVLQRRGKPVYDALAPEITWHDLNESLAPQGVRALGVGDALLGAAAQPTDALPPRVYEALVEGSATGSWPDGSGPSGVDLPHFFRRNGPRWHVAHGPPARHPGAAWARATPTPSSTSSRAWTTGARRSRPAPGAAASSSATTAGTCCPPVLPQGTDVSSDPCSERLAGGDFAALARQFMDEQLKGRDRGLGGYGRYHLATRDSTCTTVGVGAPGHDPRGRHRRDPAGAGAPDRLRGRARARSGSPARRTSPGG